ncbi:hypothetical protein MKX03_009666 [Papaver bracteatum]|nr:hypothetical protein MKX03_009666 [Papaver bracteatum]
MAETVIGPVVKIATEKGIQAFVHQISYFIHYKKNVKSLDEKVKALQAMRTEIQEKVTAAKKNLDSIKKNVEIWLDNVKKEIEEDEIMVGLMNLINGKEAMMFNRGQCCKGWCCLLTRHKIGREAHKKIFVIQLFLNDGKNFGDVSYPCANLVTTVITKFTSTENNIAFASRNFIMNEIMTALRDEDTYSVGIYGMGGVGKTMLKNRVHKQVVEMKLFSIVTTTTVSQNMNVKKIQNDIAQTLGFEKLSGIDDTTARAALLLCRLEQEKNILVVLDDLWTTNPNILTHVGIPYQYKGCKVLMTTRIPEVCSSLKIQKIVEVKGLSPDESWHLFKHNVALVTVDSPTLQIVAREVVKECGYLPLALVTVGRALQNKDKLEWDYIAHQLKSYNFNDIEGMTSEVYTPIKLSYDFLGNDILKRSFLLCCLFPEDSSIVVDNLLLYGIGDEVIRRDLETLVEVRVRLHKAFTKLVALGLLIRDKDFPDQTFSAKMHDIIRDVAISIASGNGNRFYVKAGLRLQNWPEAGLSSFSECSRLSLIDNDINVLPDQPELSHLLSLSLRNNRSLKKIPDKFFEKMNKLQALDICGVRISTLPSSMSSLVNLQSLDMGVHGYDSYSHVKHGRGFHSQLDISSLGEFIKLEILNLSGLQISLPMEIGWLTRLKWLDLSDNGGLTVPPDIISRLTCLEYLNMENSFKGWEVGEVRGENRRFSNLDEIASLPCLNHVVLKAVWGGGSLKMDTEHSRWSGPLICNLSGKFPFCNSIKILAGKAETAALVGCSNLKSMASLITSSRGSGFDNMKRLEISNCIEMECILNSSTLVNEEIPKTLFTALEVLSLSWLGSLKEVFHGPMPAFSLENLKHVQLEYCPKLVCVFSLEIMLKLKNLEELKVAYCDGLKEVFHGPMPAGLSLVNLKRVKVDNCPNLVCVFSLEVLVKLKNLEILEVINCRRLKDVFPLEEGSRPLGSNEIQEHGITYWLTQLQESWLRNRTITSIWKQGIFSLGNLKSLEVVDCHELKYLFSPAIVTAFQQLESLKIEKCNSLVVIVASVDELTLEDYQCLNNHYQTLSAFSKLRFLRIRNCDSLKNFFQPVADLHHMLEMLVPEEEEKRIERESDYGYTFGDNSDGYADRLLILQSVRYMKHTWGGIIPIQSFLNVTWAIIEHCGWLKHLIPIQILLSGGLSQLRKLQVGYCKRLEAIIDTNDDMVVAGPENHIILENLEVLIVWNCQSLKHLLPMKLLRNTLIHFGWPSLVSLFVIKSNLKRLPLSHKNVPSNLKKIRGDSEKQFDKWLELEDESMERSLRPLFKVCICKISFCSFYKMSKIALNYSLL